MRDPKVALMIKNSQSSLVRYVFNYNVLEAVSIAISTTILLAGMVRATAQQDSFPFPVAAATASPVVLQGERIVLCDHSV